MIKKHNSFFLTFLAAFFIILGGCSLHTFPLRLFQAKDGSNQSGKKSAERLFSGQRPQNLVLVTIDTLRADHLGCYGHQRAKTPTIDALARQGIMFRQAFSPIPLTLPSHASIMTGLYPPVHGLRDNGYFVLNDGCKTLAEILKKKGYTTGAVVACFVLNSRFGLDQGFDFYDDTIIPDPNRRDPFAFERRGDKVVDVAKAWLEKNKGKKFFLWLHFYDAHSPYDPPEPQRSAFSRGAATTPQDLYDGEIAFTDTCLGQLIEKMDELKLRENTLLVLTADHGEGLSDHGEKTHGVFIYDSTLHIPLIISNPGLRRGEQPEPDFLVRTIDILPTTLGLLGLARQGETYGQGVNLVPWLLGDEKQPPDLKLYAESLYTKLNFDWAPLKGVRTRNWKYIQAPTPELYRVSSDHGETENLLFKKPDLARDWEKQLRDMENDFASLDKGLTGGGTAGAQVVNDREIRQRLQSLGYLCAPRKEKSAGSEGHKPDRPPIDPKNMISVLDTLDQGQTLYGDGKLELAALQFEKILKLDPPNIFIHYLLGDVYSRQGNYQKALDNYLFVLKEQDDYLEVQNKIGSVYDHLGDYEEAMQHFRKAASFYPDQSCAYNNMGIIYIKTNRLAEAKQAFLQALEKTHDPSHDDDGERAVSLRCLGDTYLRMDNEEKADQYYQQALELRPDMVEVYLEKARYYTSHGQYLQAIPNWEKVASLQPQDSQTAFSLGQCYLLSGDRQKARQLFRECLQIQPDCMQARLLLDRLDQEQ